MSNLLFPSQFNVDSPDARRVILIPKETTLCTTPTLKSIHFWIRPYAWNQIRITFFSASCIQNTQLEVHFYTIPQMNGPQIVVFQKHLSTYKLW